ncbi:MAG: FecR family protein [Planctomycetota bacterium]|jgi:hypothetical protein
MGKRRNLGGLVLAAACLAVAGGPSVQANEQAGAPRDAEPKSAATTAPAAPVTAEQTAPLTAKVIEVVGDVKNAPVGTSPLKAEAWQPVHLDDELGGGTLIRSGLRSHVTLLFGDDMVVQVNRITLASISACYKTKTQQTIRLGLGYGAIRGGAAEGELRSDLVIDSTVATMAKRGTEGFEMAVEAQTGRYRISLAEHGLVEALQKHTGQRRLVRPGEYATEVNIANMWMRQAKFDRLVHLVESESLTPADLEFTITHARGMASVGPGAGASLVGLAGRTPRAAANIPGRAAMASLPFLSSQLPGIAVVERRALRRPEGDFGVNNGVRVLVPRGGSSR